MQKEQRMPVLSMFYGIIVRMYKENKEKHHKPHIHAKYSDNEAVVSFEGELLEGSIPQPKMRLLLAWVEIHKEDLIANWELLSNGEQCFKIEPLK
jgi:hypothetical protein